MSALTSLSALSSLSPLGGGSTAAPAASQATGAAASSSSESWLSSETAKIVTIILGLILIGVGVMSLRPVREVAVTSAKAAAAAA